MCTIGVWITHIIHEKHQTCIICVLHMYQTCGTFLSVIDSIMLSITHMELITHSVVNAITQPVTQSKNNIHCIHYLFHPDQSLKPKLLSLLSMSLHLKNPDFQLEQEHVIQTTHCVNIIDKLGCFLSKFQWQN